MLRWKGVKTMFKSIRIRAAITIALCLAAMVYLAPSLTSELPEPWKKYMPTDRIHLGLKNLRGGCIWYWRLKPPRRWKPGLTRSRTI